MKERLTGAVILVALVVLLVPELLSGPGVTAQPTRTTDEDGAPMRSYTIDLADDGGAPRPATSGDAAPDLQPLAAADDPSEPDAGEPAHVQADASPQATAASEVQTAVAEASGASAVPAESVPPAPAVQSAPEPAARAPAATERGGSATSAPVTGWIIQVGSFASRENAQRLARDLKSKGFAAGVSESRGGGRKLYRVRVGPEPDRAAAQAVLARLEARGQSGATLLPYP